MKLKSISFLLVAVMSIELAAPLASIASEPKTRSEQDIQSIFEQSAGLIQNVLDAKIYDVANPIPLFLKHLEKGLDRAREEIEKYSDAEFSEGLARVGEVTDEVLSSREVLRSALDRKAEIRLAIARELVEIQSAKTNANPVLEYLKKCQEKLLNRTTRIDLNFIVIPLPVLVAVGLVALHVVSGGTAFMMMVSFWILTYVIFHFNFIKLQPHQDESVVGLANAKPPRFEFFFSPIYIGGKYQGKLSNGSEVTEEDQFMASLHLRRLELARFEDRLKTFTPAELQRKSGLLISELNELDARVNALISNAKSRYWYTWSQLQGFSDKFLQSIETIRSQIPNGTVN